MQPQQPLSDNSGPTPGFISPYDAHIKRFPTDGEDPEEHMPYLFLLNGFDQVRKAPVMHPSPEHNTIKKMSAACSAGNLDLLKVLIARNLALEAKA